MIRKPCYSRFSLHKSVHLKFFWTQFKNVHLRGPCSLRPRVSRGLTVVLILNFRNIYLLILNRHVLFSKSNKDILQTKIKIFITYLAVYIMDSWNAKTFNRGSRRNKFITCIFESKKHWCNCTYVLSLLFHLYYVI